jgi:1-acyl-sn-glycerol-3-phosphate acyltransferase
VLAKASDVSAWPIAAACLAVAVAGRTASQLIPASPSDDPSLAIDWNPFAVTWRNLKLAGRQRAVFNSLLGISWLWFFGTIVLTSFAPFARQVLGGDENVVTLLLMTFSLGIGLGSLACERLSGRKVEIGLVPFGSIGMTVFALDLYFASRGLRAAGEEPVSLFLHEAAHWRVMADLFLLALFGGFYSVPLYALIQSRTDPAHRARIIAANNILNALFMIAASLFAIALLKAGLAIPQLFLVLAVLNAVVAAHIYMLVPEFLMRFLCWILVHSIYRLEKRGLENIPEKGPAVLVCNHVSFVDPLVILAASPRPIRFVMDHRIFATPILSFIFRTGKAIPVASRKDDPRILEQAFDRVAEALENGELVAIFPEGRITDTGELYPFRPGIQRIVERTPVPVIPLALKGLWGSFFSRVHGGKAMRNPLRNRLFAPIALEAAPSVRPEMATPEALQATVAALRGDWR